MHPSGINITKSYLFECVRQKIQKELSIDDLGLLSSKSASMSDEEIVGCGKKFVKLMVVELQHEEA